MKTYTKKVVGGRVVGTLKTTPRMTGSISRGKTAERHNTRECYRDAAHTPDNIDRARTADNVVLVNRSLEDVYAERFGEAARAYSEAQAAKGHPERAVPDYLAKVREDKQLRPMYEWVVQVGNMDEHPAPEVATAVYREWLARLEERCGDHFAVKQAVVHLDETTPHMHVELVPVAESKRGLAVQNSMNKAVKQAGWADYLEMLKGWDELLTECMRAHGIERVAGDKERQMGGVDIATYRRTMRAVDASRAEEQAAREEAAKARSEAAGAREDAEAAREAARDAKAAQRASEAARDAARAQADEARGAEVDARERAARIVGGAAAERDAAKAEAAKARADASQARSEAAGAREEAREAQEAAVAAKEALRASDAAVEALRGQAAEAGAQATEARRRLEAARAELAAMPQEPEAAREAARLREDVGWLEETVRWLAQLVRDLCERLRELGDALTARGYERALGLDLPADLDPGRPSRDLER